MKNKWGRRIGVFALAAISSALMFSTNAITAKAEDTEWNYGYTGNVQTFTAPHDGNYRLEVWGAQGGGDIYGGDLRYVRGGYGGYSAGEITLKAGDKLYICVGGSGANTFYDRYTGEGGGYNGGGGGYPQPEGDDNNKRNGGCGGGATHIALNSNRGELQYYSGNRSEILIVAGAGGGGMTSYDAAIGGYGGGASGEASRYTNTDEECFVRNTAGTQTGGYAFGKAHPDGMGGGGWYGGNIPTGNNCSGAGGSGYISPLLSNATTQGNAWGRSDITNLRYDSFYNNVLAKPYDGKAKITALHIHNYTSQITTNPTCTKDGIRTYTCTGSATDPGCGHQYTESIPALNHDCSVVVPLGTKGYEVPGRPGYFYTRKCSRCGSHYCREELGQFLQQTFVKYMDTNGNYPNDWKLADSKLVIYDQYYSWEYADRQEFKGNSVYYKVTKANNNYVYIERKKYQQQVIVYYQNADGLGDADATFTPITEVSGDYFYGSQVTWKYTPRVEYNDTVTSSRRDGTVQTSLTYNVTDHKVTEFWAFRKLVTLDINGEYLWKASVDASDESGTKYKYPNLGYSATDSNNNMGTFDIYINGKLDNQKGHNIRDYYRTDILYGSKWEVENIESDAGKHYYGSDVN